MAGPKQGHDDHLRPDLAAVTTAQQQTWSSGDFHEIARQNVVIAEALCAAADPHAGQRVLDVACGSGTAALVAARRYCEVTGIDYVPHLLERARQRARAEGLAMDLQAADAQALPFPDASFDVVLSVYGVQFAPDQAAAAAELLRVCRRGGTIGLAGPVPDGWSGDLFATHAEHAPPPAGVPPPSRWGTEDGVHELLGGGTVSIDNRRATALQYYRSTRHAVEVFSTCFGPTLRALNVVGPQGRESFLADLAAVFERYDRADDGTAVVENTYLRTVAVRG
ncbi:class I SAM-dependent methyltransferase [Actinomycetospora cinnamomea]|uniref:Methyltransferase family protein n=1 Tax=Actinomycetospora cinnamomea TaxID=663609 RepID=A0A2U1FIQ0_9PSEU|nr:class I SAM-dependent methyltransferase [Actinomycetospora cinnamomea]PVZ12063.1 methyltransferase family protein [Actinomycetospora cinnamomea]